MIKIRSSSLNVISLSLFLSGGFTGSFALAADTSTMEARTAHLKSFDLPEQTLQSGLIEFALQANITIVVDTNLLKGYNTTPVVGPLNVDAALTELLSNSPLAFHYVNTTDSYVIEPKKAGTPEAQHKVVSSEMDEVVVVGRLSFPFRYNTVTNSQVQGDIAYFDSSRFLNVIPQQLIRDQQATDLAQVLKFASGITPGDGLSDTNDDLFIRGFGRHAIYVDGFRLSDSMGVKLLPANVERVEILKGPSTLLYGQAEPGGIVNVVRKKPQDSEFVSMELGVGNLGKREINLDANGQLPLDSDINYRIILADQSQSEAGDLSDIDRKLIATSATWKISPSTIFDIGYEYQKSHQTSDRNVTALRAVEDVFPGATLEEMIKQARPGFDAEYTLFNVEINHYFNSDWRVRLAYYWRDEVRLGVRTTVDVLNKTNVLIKPGELGQDYLLLEPGGAMTIPILVYPRFPENLFAIGKIRSLYDERGLETDNNVSLQLNGTLEAFSSIHHLVLGGDWLRQNNFKEYRVETRNPYPFNVWTESEFNDDLAYIASSLFDPDRVLGELSYDPSRLLYNDFGLYLQDNIELNEQWIASLGTRYTITKGDFSDYVTSTFTQLQTYKKFSSQLGVVYKHTENYSFFANYSEALRANYHLDELGSTLAEPELSNQVEVGIKAQLMDGRLITSAALFNINKRNIVDLTLVDGVRTSLAAHEVNVKGIDCDFTWQVSNRFNVMGSLSVIEPEIKSGVNKGNIPMLAARQSGSLFAHYRVRNDLDLSAGVNYVGKRFGDDANNFYANSYTTFDVNASYALEYFPFKSRLEISVKNLTDEKYFTAVLAGVRQNYEEGRSVVGKLRMDF